MAEDQDAAALRAEPVKLDMDKLTRRQREVLGAIAIGQDGGHHPRVLAALAERGLIVQLPVRASEWPQLAITRWEVPLPVHIQWCEWCSTQTGDEEPR